MKPSEKPYGLRQDETTSYGFRHMASSLPHARGYRSEWIERQLADGDRNAASALFNFAEHLAERSKMMQEWADYLAALSSGAKG